MTDGVELYRRLLLVSYAASAFSVFATIGIAVMWRLSGRMYADLIQALHRYHQQEVRVLVAALEEARGARPKEPP